MDNFPHIVSVDPLGKFLVYIPGSSELTVCFPHRHDAREIDTVPHPSFPVLNLGNTGIISRRGFEGADDYTICELQIIHGTGCSTLRSYSSASGNWTVSTEIECDGVLPDDWGKSGSVISHDSKLWWIDIAYGIITCDLFAKGFLERLPDPFVEIQKLHFIPLPGRALLQESQDYLDKKRCVKVSNGKLRYVLLDPFDPDVNAPVVTMWTLDDPDTALWSLQYTLSLSEVTRMPLPEITPTLALIHPLNPNVLYFFKNGWIFAVDVLSRLVLHYEQYSMIYPPEQHHCSRFVYAYHPLRKELTGEWGCDSDTSKCYLDRILTMLPLRLWVTLLKPIVEATALDSSVVVTYKHMQGEYWMETKWSTANKSNEFNLLRLVFDDCFVDLYAYNFCEHADGDAGVSLQSSVFHDHQTSSVQGKPSPQQGNGNDGTETMGNTLESLRGQLITPDNFCSDTLLSESDIHLFKSAQDLRKSIDGNTLLWLSNEQGWAMLKNPSIFIVTADAPVTEQTYRGDGSCMLVDKDMLQQLRPGNYSYSNRKKQLKEQVLFLKFSGTKICQHTMKGNLWERRRLSFQGDDTFSVIQWRVAKRDDGEQACRRGCEELAAKGGVHTDKSPPAEADAPKQTSDADADAAAPNPPGQRKDVESGLSIVERIDQLQAGQSKIMRMLEQLGKRIDQVTAVPAAASSQSPSISAQARVEVRSTSLVQHYELRWLIK
ncbi:hypothetical protein ACQ4PT_017434 [Festuca glaucescens]